MKKQTKSAKRKLRKQQQELADCEEEVEEINRDLRKTVEQREAEHRVSVRETEQREEV